jgi:hypothetical protein
LALAWNPRGEHERFRRFYPQFSQWYTHIVVSTPPNPEPEALEMLRSLPELRIEAREGWEAGRMVALEMGLQTDANYVHYVDGDRLIRWVELNPDELRRTIDAVQTVDYLVIGRTPKAMATHPQALQQTEAITNDVFSHLVGQTLDLCAGSKGLSRAAAEFLLRNGDTVNGLGSDAEWVVLLHRGGFSIKGLLVDGLDWETADRYLPHAADPETQRREAEAYDADPKHWAMRVRVARETEQAGLAALTRPLKEKV